MLDLWILTHHRVGDLQQMRTLACALETRVVEKQIRFRNARLARMMPFLSVRLMDKENSSPLLPPWPDLVLVAEGAVGNIALEVRRRSGGKTKVVCLGRPRGRMSEFDLIITTPQFGLPPAPNVLELTVPLHRLDHAAMKKAAAVLRPRLSNFARPWVVLLVGGTSPPDVLDEAAASELAQHAMARAREQRGSLLVVTSPRTGTAAERTLARALGGDAHICLWSEARGGNDYLGYLHLGDRFIVTSDSISMTTEALMTGKPVEVHRLPQRLKGMRAAVEFLGRTSVQYRYPFTSGLFEVRPNRITFFDRLNENDSFDPEVEREQAKNRILQLFFTKTAATPNSLNAL